MNSVSVSTVSVVEDHNDKEPPSSTVNPKSVNFYNKYFSNTTDKEWLDYKWQLKNRITTKEQLEKIIELSESEKQALNLHKENLPLGMTPYYMSLIDNDINDPIRKCVVPRIDETIISPEESIDPLDENHQNPVSCIVHRYPDRVLFLATKFCSSSCRYCTRARIINEEQERTCEKTEWDNGFEYIKSHPEVRDVLISGGDPLTMTDSKIEYILSNLRKIEHVEIVRIGTKIPAVLPQRVTPELVNILKKYHPLFMSVHFTHPNELTEESKKACEMLADAGIPLGSQTVLLKGVNDNSDILGKLFKGLLRQRVRPYYLYAGDKIVGSSHFRTKIELGINIMKDLQGKVSGYAIPKFIIDLPQGMGKVPVLYNYIKKYGEEMEIENYEGYITTYSNSWLLHTLKDSGFSWH